MSQKHLFALLGISFLSWLALCYLLLYVGDKVSNGLALTAYVLICYFLSSGIFLVGYTFYLIRHIVPKVAELVDKATHDLMVNHNETGFYRFHWLTTYSLCIISRRMSRRFVRRGAIVEYDFRLLPSELRVPLSVWFYWFSATFFSGVLGSLILKWVEYRGSYQFSDF